MFEVDLWTTMIVDTGTCGWEVARMSTVAGLGKQLKLKHQFEDGCNTPTPNYYIYNKVITY